jgi:HlyD family secretion protein
MMRYGLMLVVTTILAASLLYGIRAHKATESATAAVSPHFASTGRVEPASETIAVGAATSGVVERVFVVEGQNVIQGQLMARILCRDVEASLQVVKAKVSTLRYERVRIFRGARDEERMVARKRREAAEAVLTHQQKQAYRMRDLFLSQIGSRTAFEDAQRDYDVADAQLQAAEQEEKLSLAGPLPEEKAKAEAELASADAQQREVEQELSKCAIRSPKTGTVLKSYIHEGESFSTYTPRPLFLLGDLTRMRIRAELDEFDVLKVRAGQRVTVWQDGRPDLRFDGRVVRIGDAMGRKTVLTGDPAEKSDRDVLEVIVELADTGVKLPTGLRVTVLFNE